jgi:hypothetical protein
MKIIPLHTKAMDLLVLERWGGGDVSAEIAQILGVTRQRINRWRREPDFIAEYHRRLDLWRANFKDVPLAHRKERVIELQSLYNDLKNAERPNVNLKVKVLQAIRQEVGDDRMVVEHEHHHSGDVGVRVPPRAASYDEWLKQNEQMEQAVPVEAEVVNA